MLLSRRAPLAWMGVMKGNHSGLIHNLVHLVPLEPVEASFCGLRHLVNRPGGPSYERGPILRLCCAIRLGYYLRDDGGMMSRRDARGAWRLQRWTRSILSLVNKATVPGWYDTHARHSSAGHLKLKSRVDLSIPKFNADAYLRRHPRL